MQHLAELANGDVEAVIEVDESVGGPDYPPQLVACHHLAGVFQQGIQDQERLILELQAAPALEDLPAAQVEREYSKLAQVRCIRHRAREVVCRKSSAKYWRNQLLSWHFELAFLRCR